MALGTSVWGYPLIVVVSLAPLWIGVETVAREQDVLNRKPPSETCNSTSWGHVNIRVPSVHEPMGGSKDSICNTSVPVVVVEEVVWRCERRYCCQDNCHCGNDSVTEELCTPQAPRIVPIELICLVQHKRPPRFYRYICCRDFVEVDTICVPHIDCDGPDGGGCAHDCVRGNATHTCTCRAGYQLTNRRECAEVSMTTPSTTVSTTSTSIMPSTTSTMTTITSTRTSATTTTITTIANSTSTTTAMTVSHMPDLIVQRGPSLWVLILLPLGAAIVLFVICFCILCRKWKPLYAVHEDAQTTSYENESYGNAATGMAVIHAEYMTSKKGCPPISMLETAEGDQSPKSIKFTENDVHAGGVATVKGVPSKELAVVYGNSTAMCINMDEDDCYTMPEVSVYASGLPPPYQKEDPHDVMGEGAIGGAPLAINDPLRVYRTAEVENDLNENLENIYSEIP